MLLPVDLREWVSADDTVHLVLEAVEQLALDDERGERGRGSAQYPPGMMLALLIYCYSQGIYSSRKIEHATHVNVAVRYLTGDTHPDHDTIAKFRRQQGALLRRAFVEVLTIATEVGMARLGTVCLDGTKLKAMASARANHTALELAAEQRELEVEIAQRLDQAEQADQASECEQLPPSLKSVSARRSRVRAAREAIARRAAEQNREPRDDDRGNTSDADSRPMRTRKGTIQGYNAQAAACVHTRLIQAAHVTTQNQDRRQLIATLEALPPEVARPHTVVADTGYDQHDQIVRAQATWGVQVYIPPQSPVHIRHRQSRADAQRSAERLARHQRVHTAHGQKLMRMRRTVIEPIFGILKSAMGFERFHLRGLAKVNTEWTLLCTAYNLRTIQRWRLRQTA